MRGRWTLAFLLLPTALFALQVDQGRMRLVIHEGIGRFSLYHLPTAAGSDYQPLLLDDDPRTTVVSVIEGNRVYRMGESSAFTEAIEPTSGGAVILWTGKNLLVRQEFMFVTSAGSVLADGLRIDVTVRNIGSRQVMAGLRYLLDTYLGEGVEAHFTLSSGEKVTRERTALKGSMGSFWQSAPEGAVGLQVMTGGTGVTIPDRVVFANWKRLNDASWDYETSTSRNFNLLPYSINDSGASLYYDPREVAALSDFTVTLVMGASNPTGFSADAVGSTSKITQILEKATTDRAEDPVLSLRADVQTLDDLIQQINLQLAGGKIQEAELPVVEQVIRELRKKYP